MQPIASSSSMHPRHLLQEVHVWSESSGSSSSSTSSMDTEEAEFEALHSLYDLLRKQEAQLEATKSDRTELEKLRSELLLQQEEGGSSGVLWDVWEPWSGACCPQSLALRVRPPH